MKCSSVFVVVSALGKAVKFDDNKSIFYDITVIDEVKRRKDCVFLIISRDPFGSNFSTSCFSEAVYSIGMSREGTRRVYKFSTLCCEDKWAR